MASEPRFEPEMLIDVVTQFVQRSQIQLSFFNFEGTFIGYLLVKKQIRVSTNSHGTDLAVKMQSGDVISLMHCLNSLKNVAEL